LPTLGGSLFGFQPFFVGTTDSNGDYTVNNLTPGSYEVGAEDSGYVNGTSAAFTVSTGNITAPTVALAVDPTTLPVSNPLKRNK